MTQGPYRSMGQRHRGSPLWACLEYSALALDSGARWEYIRHAPIRLKHAVFCIWPIYHSYGKPLDMYLAGNSGSRPLPCVSSQGAIVCACRGCRRSDGKSVAKSLVGCWGQTLGHPLGHTLSPRTPPPDGRLFLVGWAAGLMSICAGRARDVG